MSRAHEIGKLVREALAQVASGHPLRGRSVILGGLALSSMGVRARADDPETGDCETSNVCVPVANTCNINTCEVLNGCSKENTCVEQNVCSATNLCEGDFNICSASNSDSCGGTWSNVCHHDNQCTDGNTCTWNNCQLADTCSGGENTCGLNACGTNLCTSDDACHVNTCALSDVDCGFFDISCVKANVTWGKCGESDV